MGLFFNNQDIANAGVTEKAVLYSRSRFSCEPSEIGAAKPDGARVLREAPAAFRRLCVETIELELMDEYGMPAAFRRLCVETNTLQIASDPDYQPPSGGCVLKLLLVVSVLKIFCQPPSGGCVLKLPFSERDARYGAQPPSGGCVLKHDLTFLQHVKLTPAAFRRLCVETITYGGISFR